MRAGMIGLGKMGGNMAARLREAGHEIVGYDPHSDASDVGSLADRQVRAPRSVAFVSETLSEAERERASAAVPKVFTRSPAVVATTPPS